jgi:hypothetical protein
MPCIGIKRYAISDTSLKVSELTRFRLLQRPLAFQSHINACLAKLSPLPFLVATIIRYFDYLRAGFFVCTPLSTCTFLQALGFGSGFWFLVSWDRDRRAGKILRTIFVRFWPTWLGSTSLGYTATVFGHSGFWVGYSLIILNVFSSIVFGTSA